MPHQSPSAKIYRSVVFFGVMVFVLFPICVSMILGAKNERPTRMFYWHALTGGQRYLLAFENGPTRGKLYCMDLKSGMMISSPVKRINSFRSVSNFSTQLWAYDYQGGQQGVLQTSKLSSGEFSESIISPFRFPVRLEHLKDTKNFLASRFSSSVIMQVEQFLFEVADGKLRRITSWLEIDHYQF